MYWFTFGNSIYCLVESEQGGREGSLLSTVSVPQSLMKELQISHDCTVNLTVHISIFFSPRIWRVFCRKYFNTWGKDFLDAFCACYMCHYFYSESEFSRSLKDYIIFSWRKTKLSDFFYSTVQDICALQPISHLKVWSYFFTDIWG